MHTTNVPPPAIYSPSLPLYLHITPILSTHALQLPINLSYSLHHHKPTLHHYLDTAIPLTAALSLYSTALAA
jgi:hypothetical protein